MNYILAMALFGLANLLVVTGLTNSHQARREINRLEHEILKCRDKVLADENLVTLADAIEEAEAKLMTCRLFLATRQPSFALSCAQKARQELVLATCATPSNKAKR